MIVWIENAKRYCRSHHLIGAVVVLFIAYVCIALSPLPQWLGRFSPSAASFISPPLMNFHGTYESGEVLGIRIGMSRTQLQVHLRTAFSDHALQGACGGSTGLPQFIPISGELLRVGRGVSVHIDDAELAFASATAKDVICIASFERPQMVLVFLTDEYVRRVEVNFNRGPT